MKLISLLFFLFCLKIPSSYDLPANQVKAFMKEDKLYIMTAYFTDPDTICSGQRATEVGYVGDNLYLAMHEGIVKIPLREADIGGTKWTLGRCFAGMGNKIDLNYFTYIIAEESL